MPGNNLPALQSALPNSRVGKCAGKLLPGKGSDNVCDDAGHGSIAEQPDERRRGKFQLGQIESGAVSVKVVAFGQLPAIVIDESQRIPNQVVERVDIAGEHRCPQTIFMLEKFTFLRCHAGRSPASVVRYISRR